MIKTAVKGVVKGFTSKANSDCKPCNENTYGNKCAETCMCGQGERCDNVKWCLKVEKGITMDSYTSLLMERMIQKRVVYQNFYIIDQIQHSLIIGNDFLEYNKANINYPTKTLNLYDGIAQIALISTRQNEAKTLKHIELPARKISIIPVKIPKQYIGKQIILEPSQSLQNKSIVGAACLVSSSTQQAVMQVINPNEDKVVLNRNEIVALISEIQPNSIQNWSDKTEKVHINNIEKGHKKQKQKLNIDLSEADLTNDQKEKLRKFVDKNRNVFATDLSEIGMTDVHFHEIDTGNNPPVSLPHIELHPILEQRLKDKLKRC
ncbi:MEGF10_11 [Mytilus edulis]|uniref:MEGF10_11 n=1 Tax=Mytilus edulis TaxID=6550 RepID=A0A8S3UX26_MYTED|nr:MEGF10_11 [Mytilus edulis]